MKEDVIRSMVLKALESKKPEENLAVVCDELVRAIVCIACSLPIEEHREHFLETFNNNVRNTVDYVLDLKDKDQLAGQFLA